VLKESSVTSKNPQFKKPSILHKSFYESMQSSILDRAVMMSFRDEVDPFITTSIV